ncbi:hypothetical protein GCM10025878_13900 [Leuconostoc gasicomitatum]|nr:hypothetical protein [Leuconostoc gasicomitatum]GMA06319.1 hypothetical protein GCM10025878_13900 [Leuconostoc gasicomitatum]CBL92223.1 hypothetical protein LEGAS_1575 [Leuconostoc gasicomitatum LMG 18811]
MNLNKDKVIEKLIQQNASQSLAIVQLQTLVEQYQQTYPEKEEEK